jgi:tetratricopeptide (TPR) repeat protein
MPVPKALARLDQMLADVSGQPYSVAVVLEAVALLRAMRGEIDDARRLIREAEAVYTELGMPPYRHAIVALYSGPAELVAGDPNRAETILGSACDVLREHGETGVRATLASYRAEALYRLGRYEDAEQATRESNECATQDDSDAHARWRGVQAKIEARRGDIEHALELNSEALGYLENSDYLNYVATYCSGAPRFFGSRAASKTRRRICVRRCVCIGRRGTSSPRSGHRPCSMSCPAAKSDSSDRRAAARSSTGRPPHVNCLDIGISVGFFCRLSRQRNVNLDLVLVSAHLSATHCI